MKFGVVSLQEKLSGQDSTMKNYKITRLSKYQKFLLSLGNEARDMLPFVESIEIDMSNIMHLKEQYRHRRKHAHPFSLTAIIIKAISLAIRKQGEFNSVIIPFSKKIVTFQDIHAAVAVEKEYRGSYIPFNAIIESSDKKDLIDITKELEALKKLRPEEIEQFHSVLKLFELPACLQYLITRIVAFIPTLRLKHRGSFFVTTVAGYGVEVLSGPTTHPASFVFGAIKMKPVVSENRVVIRPMMNLIGVFDRRLFSGAPAAKLLHRIKVMLEKRDLTS